MKKNVRRKKIVSILLIAFLILIATNVYAANDKFETTLKVNNSKVNRQATVAITIGLDNIKIESGEKGIGGYTGNIKFDPSVLEYVSAEGTDKWDKPLYRDGAITSTTSDGEVVNTKQDIATITFKVKNDAKLGDTTIELKNFSGSIGEVKDGEESDIPTNNKSIKLTVVDNNGGSGNKNPGSSTSDKTNANDSNKQQSNIKDGVLPQTGKNNVAIFVTIAGCILFAIILYTRIKNIKTK